MELVHVLESIQEAIEIANASIAWDALKIIIDRSELLRSAWSRSWIGYHAFTYYDKFAIPPISRPFGKRIAVSVVSTRYRRDDTSWITYRPDAIETLIYNGLDSEVFRNSIAAAQQLEEQFHVHRRNVLALIEVASSYSYLTSIDELSGEISSLGIQTANERIDSEKPSLVDELWAPDPNREDVINVPIHTKALATCRWIHNVRDSLESLVRFVEESMSLMQLSNSESGPPRPLGSKIFIGHGRDKSWIVLRNFLKETLGLPILEYEEKIPAGSGILDHVMSIISEAGIAFLVMTGEDTAIDKEGKEKLHPRLNVVHELGICQSKLGQMRAIALVEKGCNVPTNIIGINHIPFEKDNILSASQRIRDVLEREGIM